MIPKITLARRAIDSNARQHRYDEWRPDFHMLAEEMLELSLALRGQHEHPPWLELVQIGGIVTNWLADIMVEQGDTEIVEYLKRGDKE